MYISGTVATRPLEFAQAMDLNGQGQGQGHQVKKKRDFRSNFSVLQVMCS